MKKVFLFIFLRLFFQDVSYCQLTFRYYNDRLTLYKNKEFCMEVHRHLSHGEVWGNWKQYNDSIIILDQNDKCNIDVIEKKIHRKKKHKKISTIFIPEEELKKITKYNYKICVISAYNDTIIFPTKEITINKEIKAIYLKDSQNIKTDIWYKKKKNSNFYEIRPYFFMESLNNPWVIRGKNIFPYNGNLYLK